MSELTKLTLAEARAGLEAKRFSATELTKALLAAVDAGNGALNAYVLATPEIALRQAKESDKRIAKGQARPLEGLPIGVKDLYCTRGVRTTACSSILGEFTPTYEATVTQSLWDAGAVLLGKLNCDEFAMGSSNETSRFGPVVSPWRRRFSSPPAAADAQPVAVPQIVTCSPGTGGRPIPSSIRRPGHEARD